ncbi:transglycosylase SLT domain-containing protein [Streptomyces sp. NPDC047718]|uniref:transglycosylase SLT domain-containing protein n=1 Tax=Streptomyces sp. NPDC047718 TaxID=3155479 RepID=UPI0034004554
MSKTSIRGRRMTKAHKMSFAAVATVGAAAVAATLVPGGAANTGTAEAAVAAPVAMTAQTTLTAQQAVAAQDAAAAAKAKADAAAAAAAKAKAEAAAKKARAQAASRAAARKPVFANNLDGWIKEALFIMKKEGIPGTYAGIHKNVMRESSGNPLAINNWDINAKNGIPSKGLLQVIYPTFKAYHVPGTKFDQYDPVANIVAACNYAADRYGTIDNVNSAY